jgi:hypothetical protein
LMQAVKIDPGVDLSPTFAEAFNRRAIHSTRRVGAGRGDYFRRRDRLLDYGGLVIGRR